MDFIKFHKESISKVLPTISSNSLKVWIAISCELEWGQPEIALTINEIIAKTGLERRIVMKSLKELDQKLLITRLGSSQKRKYLVNNMYIRLGTMNI